MLKSLACVVGVLIAVIAAPNFSSATMVTVHAFGHITDFEGSADAPASGLSLGDAFEIEFTYESSSLDISPSDPGVGLYAGAVRSMSVVLAGIRTDLSLSNGLAIADPDQNGVLYDDRLITLEVAGLGSAQNSNYQALGISIPAQGERLAAYLALENLVPGTLSSDALVLPPPVGSASPGVQLYFQRQLIGQWAYDVRGAVDRIAVATHPVPEPTGAVLFGIGTILVGVFGMRR